MTKIFEITTITGGSQTYEIIEVSPMTFASGKPGVSIKNLTNETNLDSPAVHVHNTYSMTGLDDVIKLHPARLKLEDDGKRFTGAEIIGPERLRLIYDAFPGGCIVPILSICPIKDEQIWIARYDVKKAKLPLEEITFSNEFEGSLNMDFAGLKVVLHLRNFDAENEHYYSRDLKKNWRREDSRGEKKDKYN